MKKIFAFFYFIRIKILIFIKRKKIFKLNPQLKNIKINEDLKKKYKKRYKNYYKSALEWYKLYSGVNNISSEFYVPEDFYYISIEPTLNNKIFTSSYADKNFYDIIFKDFQYLLPKTILRLINNRIYDKNYEIINLNSAYIMLNDCNFNELILKPSTSSSGGRNVYLLKKINNKWFIVNQNHKEFFIENFLNSKNNYIIQEKINSHPFFKSFNDTSLNTIRVFVYSSIKDNDTFYFNIILRIGQKNSIVDNQASGGYSIGINSDGLLNNFAINKYGNKFYIINDNINLKTNSFIVPFYKEIIEYSKILAKKLFYHRLIAFDFCIDNNNNIRLLEINLQNIEINFMQFNNGPLFGNFIDEIIDYCNNNFRTLKIDFHV